MGGGGGLQSHQLGSLPTPCPQHSAAGARGLWALRELPADPGLSSPGSSDCLLSRAPSPGEGQPRGWWPSQVLQGGVLRALQQGQQVQGRDAGHMAGADLQHADQALRHGGSKVFYLQR